MQIKQILPKKITLGLKASYLWIFLWSGFLTLAMLIVAPNSIVDLAKCLIKSHLLMGILNFLPIFLLMLLLFYLFGSFSISCSLVTFLVALVSIVNRLKMQYRFDPFVPWDILLGGEVLGISKSFDLKLVILVLGALILICIVSIGFCYVVKNPKLKISVRLFGIVSTLIVMFFVNVSFLSNKKINNSLPVIGNVYNQSNQFNSKGFVYQFIYTYNTGKIVKPKDYNAANIEKLQNETVATVATVATQTKKPHVFLILGEAFSEIPMSPVLNYDGFVDPLANYKNILKEAYSGNIIVPNIGGGTADTEFDILTGINVRQFRGVPYGNTLVTKPMDGALPQILKANGYNAIAMHPGFPWFYNRQNVFQFLGFESFTSIESFDEKDNKGMYINETVTYDRVIADFYEHLKTNPQNPLFSLVITIQNHGPYDGKYGAKKNFNSSVNFNEKDTDTLSNYIEGVGDQDRELGRLVDEMKNSDEPVVIVYFGDHLPLLSGEVYDALIDKTGNSPIVDEMRLNTTPYFIWANDAAKPLIHGTENFPENGEMSSFYLGASLLEYLGLNQEDNFFKFLNENKVEIPVITEAEYFTKDGKIHIQETESNEKLSIYQQWSYFKIFDTDK